MSYTLCEKVSSLEPYKPISGTYKIRLDANESSYDLPDEIKSEIKNIIDKIDFNRYPDSTAEKTVKSFADFYGLDPDTITAANGSDELLYIISSAMLMRGSKVIIVEPDFSMYRFYSVLAENEIISVKKSGMMMTDTDMLIKISNDENADMIIFSNPCNPTGLGIKADDARRLVKSVNALVVIDEAYMDFWDQPLLKEAASYENLIVLKTASKAIGSAAIRLGFAVSNKTVTKALKAVKSPYNVNTLTQEIGACIYSHKEILKARREEIVKNTKSLYKELLKIQENYKLPVDIIEPCANFVLIKTDFAKELFEYLSNNGIAVRFFSDLSALRITAGTESENSAMLKCTERYIIEKYLSLNN